MDRRTFVKVLPTLPLVPAAIQTQAAAAQDAAADAAVEVVRSSGEPGSPKPRVPGESSLATRSVSETDGIHVEDDVWEAILALPAG